LATIIWEILSGENIYQKCITCTIARSDVCKIGGLKVNQDSETVTSRSPMAQVRERDSRISRRSFEDARHRRRARANVIQVSSSLRRLQVGNWEVGYQLPVSISGLLGLLVRSGPTTFSRLRVGVDRSPRDSLTYERRHGDYLSSVRYYCVIVNARIETSQPLCHLFLTWFPSIAALLWCLTSRVREGWLSWLPCVQRQGDLIWLKFRFTWQMINSTGGIATFLAVHS